MTLRSGWALGAALLLGACGSDSGQPPPAAAVTSALAIEVVHRDANCPATSREVRVIDDPEQWSAWLAGQLRTTLPATPRDPSGDPQFDAVDVIVIAMGRQPTGGYSVDVPEDAVSLENGVLTIGSVWGEPAAGAVLPQVVTSPCIAIAVPRAEYETVRVENQAGETIIEQRR